MLRPAARQEGVPQEAPRLRLSQQRSCGGGGKPTLIGEFDCLYRDTGYQLWELIHIDLNLKKIPSFDNTGNPSSNKLSPPLLNKWTVNRQAVQVRELTFSDLLTDVTQVI